MIGSGAVIRIGKSSTNDLRFTTLEVLAIKTRCLETAAAMADQKVSLILGPAHHLDMEHARRIMLCNTSNAGCYNHDCQNHQRAPTRGPLQPD